VAIVVVPNSPLTTYLPPPSALASAQGAELWFRSLPPNTRVQFESQMRGLVATLSPTQRMQLGRYLAQNEIAVPPELGLGQWAGIAQALVSAAAAAGTQIAVAKMGAKTSEQLASQSTATQEQVANIQGQAAAQAAQIMANATVGAAKEAAGADVTIAKTQSAATVSVLPTVMKWGAIAFGAVALIGVVSMLARRRGSSAPAAPAPAPSAAAAPATAAS
jgi:hypothetical protein